MVAQFCCVKGCNSRSHDSSGKKLDNGIRFYTFPACKKHEGDQTQEIRQRRRTAWVSAVRRKNITFNHIPAYMKVCSLHFHSGQPAYEMLETHPDWVPSLRLGHDEPKATSRDQLKRPQQQQESEELEAQELEQQEDQEMAQEEGQELADQEAEELEKEEAQELARQEAQERARREAQERAQKEALERARREVQERARREAQERMRRAALKKAEINEDCSSCRTRRDEVNRLLVENRRLKHELEEKRITDQFLKDDNEKVKYYTGLPTYATFLALLNHVLPHISQGRKALTPFQMVLLTFMRLRLDLPIQHIAHLFGVHRATVAQTFRDTVAILYTRLNSSVHWPDRDSLRVTMPHQFAEAFGNRVAFIIDCFEVFTERPSNSKARAETFSNRKQHHTQKYLIGIVPQGIISFVSKGWGGRTTDKHVLENSGFLDQLLPGDIVLAKHGFDDQESVGLMCAEVKKSSKGRCKLVAKDVEETKDLAHLRLHVERLIVNINKKYKILSGTMPVKMVIPGDDEENVTFMDKIVTVCCALTNMSPSMSQPTQETELSLA